jgi:hypothetical protein
MVLGDFPWFKEAERDCFALAFASADGLDKIVMILRISEDFRVL